MKFVGLREAQAQLSGLVDRSQKERIVLTRHGQPIAVLSGIRGKDLEAVLLAGDPQFRKLIQERRSYQGELVTHEALRREAERELADERKAARPGARTEREPITPSRPSPRKPRKPRRSSQSSSSKKARPKARKSGSS